MSASLPSEIVASETEHSVCYWLPRRPLGQGRILALIFILAGLSFATIPIVIILPIGIGPANPFGWFDVVFIFGRVAGVVSFVAVGLLFAGLGFLALVGRCEIEVVDGWLKTFDGIGSRGWRRQRCAANLRRLVVEHHPVKHNEQPIRTGPLAGFALIKAEFDGDKPMRLAIGYPQSWLRPLADHLAERCRLSTEPGIVPSARPPIEVTLISVLHSEFVELAEQPPRSRITLEENPTGFLLRVPAAGLFRRGGGGYLFWFGVVWCCLTLSFTVGALFAPIQGDAWILLLFLIAFWAVGAGLMVGALNLARRQAVLAVVDDTLMVMQTGIFGSRRWEWRRDDLCDIIAGKSNVTVNDQPVIELQILPKEGKRVGVLLGRGTDELRWLATVLRRALKLPTTE
jgi:hypothetical protein